MGETAERILFYDGECGLCQGAVRFLMRHDRGRRLCFAPLQGETAAALLEPGLRQSLDTVVYRRGSEAPLLRSAAVLQALIDTGSWWRFLVAAALRVPRSWRDTAYDWVARRRHRLGWKKECRLPTPEEREQLLP